MLWGWEKQCIQILKYSVSATAGHYLTICQLFHINNFEDSDTPTQRIIKEDTQTHTACCCWISLVMFQEAALHANCCFYTLLLTELKQALLCKVPDFKCISKVLIYCSTCNPVWPCSGSGTLNVISKNEVWASAYGLWLIKQICTLHLLTSQMLIFMLYYCSSRLVILNCCVYDVWFKRPKEAKSL